MIRRPASSPSKRTRTLPPPPPGAPAWGAWGPLYPEVATPRGSRPPFEPVAEANGPLTSVDIWTDEIRTAEGIGLGSTEEEVLAAYPGIVDEGADPDMKVYVVPGSLGELVLEVTTAR